MRLLPPLLVVLAITPAVEAQRFHMRRPVHYKQSRDDNAVTELNRRIASGEVVLEPAGKAGRLAALLRELGIPASSQMLVFSKTSKQRHRISPRSPRALYFGRDAYVGWAPGSASIEVVASDPKLGLVFYSLPQDPDDRGLLRRDDECLRCHAGPRTENEPGLMLRSVFPDDEGNPIAMAGETTVTVRTPLEDRWGGWLVTGRFAGEHRGNGFATRDENRRWCVRGAATTDPKTLAENLGFPLEVYPSPSGSDIGALLAFEQQATVHNTIVQASLQMRVLLDSDRRLAAELGEGEIGEQTGEIADDLAYRITRDLFLGGEPSLRGRAAAPDPGFARDFAALWPEDSHGVRLGRLSLRDGLFELPLSPMVHSAAFAAMPRPLRERVLLRLRKGLARGRLPEGVVIPKDQRSILHEHLRETLAGYDR